MSKNGSSEHPNSPRVEKADVAAEKNPNPTGSSPRNLDKPVVKKPYEKPSFRYEEVFVTSALMSNKVTGTTHCSGPKKS